MEKVDLNNYEFDANKLFRDLDRNKALELLKDAEDLEEGKVDYIKKIKETIIASELVNLSDEDVLSDIKLLKDNIPKNLTPLETVRWLYINIGKLFSYDYRVANDPKYGYGKNINTAEYINRYQTCVQISDIFNRVLNGTLDENDFPIEGVKSKVISRTLDDARGQYGQNHVANEVIVDNGDWEFKLLLDLTLDLYLIQSDCHTKHFGFEDDGSGTYDIIPKMDNIAMDNKLGLIMDESDYTDERIKKASELIRQFSATNNSDKDIIEYKIKLINQLTKKFPGYHEGKQYLNMLFHELLKAQYREFNLFYNKDGEVNLKTVYKITSGDYEKWIMYSNRLGLMSTDEISLRNMLEDDWETNSETLKKLIFESDQKKY